jgi:hypothetical protein
LQCSVAEASIFQACDAVTGQAVPDILEYHGTFIFTAEQSSKEDFWIYNDKGIMIL